MFEDALAGVAAGRAGKFGFVVGVDRVGPGRGAARARRRRRRSRPRRAARATVIAQPAFAVEPWSVRETELDLDVLAQTESVFALANGHIGLRGNLDEGEPNGLPGTYLNSFYELRPLPYAEAATATRSRARRSSTSRTARSSACSSTTSRSTSATGKLLAHERELDLRAGVLVRQRRLDVARRRTPSAFARRGSSRSSQRAVAAIQYEVEPLDGPLRVVVQSELVANEPGAAPPKTDPRAAAVLESPLRSEDFFDRAAGASCCCTRRKRSELRMGAGMDHMVEGPDGTDVARREPARTSAG